MSRAPGLPMVTVYASRLRGAGGEASQVDRAGGAAPCPGRNVRKMGSSAAPVLGLPGQAGLG